MPFPVGEGMGEDTQTHSKSKRPVIYSIVAAEGDSGCHRHLIITGFSVDLQRVTHPTVRIH